jgi:hypothetical protein
MGGVSVEPAVVWLSLPHKMYRLWCRHFINLQHVCCKRVLRAVTCVRLAIGQSYAMYIIKHVCYQSALSSNPVARKRFFGQDMKLYWNPTRPFDVCDFIYNRLGNCVWTCLVSVGGETASFILGFRQFPLIIYTLTFWHRNLEFKF